MRIIPNPANACFQTSHLFSDILKKSLNILMFFETNSFCFVCFHPFSPFANALTFSPVQKNFKINNP